MWRDNNANSDDDDDGGEDDDDADIGFENVIGEHLLNGATSHKAGLCEGGQPANTNQMTGPRREVSRCFGQDSHSQSCFGGKLAAWRRDMCVPRIEKFVSLFTHSEYKGGQSAFPPAPWQLAVSHNKNNPHMMSSCQRPSQMDFHFANGCYSNVLYSHPNMKTHSPVNAPLSFTAVTGVTWL